jgi:hypothetical protein
VAGVRRRADAGGELGGGGGGAGGGEIKWHSRYSCTLCLGRERKIFLKIKRRGVAAVALPFWLVVAGRGVCWFKTKTDSVSQKIGTELLQWRMESHRAGRGWRYRLVAGDSATCGGSGRAAVAASRRVGVGYASVQLGTGEAAAARAGSFSLAHARYLALVSLKRSGDWAVCVTGPLMESWFLGS